MVHGNGPPRSAKTNDEKKEVLKGKPQEFLRLFFGPLPGILNLDAVVPHIRAERKDVFSFADENARKDPELYSLLARTKSGTEENPFPWAEVTVYAPEQYLKTAFDPFSHCAALAEWRFTKSRKCGSCAVCLWCPCSPPEEANGKVIDEKYKRAFCETSCKKAIVDELKKMPGFENASAVKCDVDAENAPTLAKAAAAGCNTWPRIVERFIQKNAAEFQFAASALKEDEEFVGIQIFVVSFSPRPILCIIATLGEEVSPSIFLISLSELTA